MQKTVNQIFIEWLEFLKKFSNVSNATAARRINMPVHKVSNIKKGRASASREELLKLPLAFPELIKRASESGFDIEELNKGKVVETKPNALKKLEEDVEELKKMVSRLEKNQFIKDETIKKLIDMIDRQEG